MKYFDTFTGIGGFTLAINNAYEKLCIKNEEQVLQGVGDSEGQCSQLNNICTDGLTCVGYSEIDKYASSIYQKHYPNHKNYGDITKINAEELPDFDLLVGGFPCQAFSIAGKRGGFEDTRGTLFFDLARILRTKKPRLFVFENVKGLLSHDKGNTFKTIISTLDELGYDTQWQVLNSKNFGVPQNRERVFIVGHLRGTSRPEVFPIGGQTETNAGNAFYDESQWRREGKLREYNGVSPTLNTAQGGGHIPLIPTQLGNSKKYGNASGSDVAYTLRASEPNGVMIANTLDANYHKGNSATKERHTPRTEVMQDMKIRRLTPTECERLQGFHDGWTEGVSDTQRYKCCGNAVTVNVVQAIMERLI